MSTLMKPSDARIRIAAQKIERIAAEITAVFDKVNIDVTDALIEILYNKTRAIRTVQGVDRAAYACVKNFLDNFNLYDFARQHRISP